MSRALLALLFVAALSGCPPSSSAPCVTDTECPEGRCRFGGCGPVCLDDTECPAGHACTAGACQERAECVASTDCAQGFTCSAGRCLCDADTACAANQVCRQGRCEAQARCTGNADCPSGQRCEVTQGACLPVCTTAASCAPGVDPQVANVLFVCQDGTCVRRCINDASCGGQGLLCEAGLCERADCATRADCPEGQYCTSATAGRCREYRVCQSRAECPENTDCRAFDASACPPGFDCARAICQELPRCLIDTDCTAPAYCQQGYCQPSTACPTGGPCPAGLLCVAQRCVPGGCRGHADCPASQACTDGACRSAPDASEISALAITPRAAVLAVGGEVRLSLVAFTFSGESFPLAMGSFSVVDASGAPSDAATVTPSGVVTAAAPGTVRIRAGVSNPGVTPVEAALTLLPAVTEGRRVVVVDATTGRPLSGVEVLGCDAPPASAPCPAPVTVTTDASGAALFPSFAGTTASFSAASPELRSDDYPRYDRVSVAATGARDVLLPLGENPVHGAAGFNAGIQFSEVHSSGPVWLGFSVLSAGDVPELDLTTLLGETFFFTVPGLPQPVPAPGSAVAYVASGLGSPMELKGRSLGLGQPGRRAAVAFAGRTELTLAASLGSTDLLAYTGAMDYALQAFATIPLRPRVPDTSDLDADGLCSDASRCAQGSEDLPDYFTLPGFSFRPRREQLRRTEVVLPRLPSGLDTAIASAVELSAEAGIVPLGFASRTGGAPAPDGTRPLEPLLLRSGAPYGGVELGTPGVWVFATQVAQARGDTTGRLLRGSPLPTRVQVPPFLPLPVASYDRTQRAFTPAAERWTALSQAGAELARITFTGPRSRHVVLLPLVSGQSPLRLPAAPPGVGEDPATQQSATGEVVAMDLSAGITWDGALDLPGANLLGLSLYLDAYSRARSW
ncbi:Ig-like domain-containing protein [Hyalangium rubrum]|uniref:BIG2 domain-containing protein n=1 Tax=Hyalangium rubrum TaxID=3103134 RepID=A0ABU5H541_9BACT|nr:hypothetical protein [Hyalangium sp. s54d21]MDY7227938.1 hypothetical protein [Hyalangium sp. s54d21]